ncbi:MAG: GNAT family N-acetyltransferase [Anaerolineaceae bacterium]|nr:GNAT family N-acetyltransferase [Anaerolineaceae bacterium]
MKVFEVTEMSQKVYDAFERLLPQLSSSAQIPTWDELSDLIASKAGIVLAAVDDEDPEEKILGTMTLVVFRIPTGVRAWVEDVVVDKEARGKGIGEKLIRTSIERAKAEGAKTIDLTSRPSRVEAHRLYKRCGFEMRETCVFRRIP